MAQTYDICEAQAKLFTMKYRFFGYNGSFEAWGGEHIIVMLLMLAASIFIPLYAKYNWSRTQQLWGGRIMAIILASTIIFWTLTRIALGDFDYKEDFPINACNAMALTGVILLWNPTPQVHEIFYYWTFAGTFQAILTPDLIEAFPAFTFFKYWIVHCGLVVYMIYLTVVFEFYPTLKGMLKAVWIAQIYALIFYFVNLLIDANYMYLVQKPANQTILDFFGPWPIYILVAQLLGVVLFLLSWLPIKIFVLNRQPKLREQY